MRRPMIFVAKFVGTVSLGLLTGTHYSTSVASLKAILSLPSAPSAQSAFTSLSATLTELTQPLSYAASSALLFAYLFSPRYQKHPYLLMTAIAPLLSVFWRSRVLGRIERDIEKMGGAGSENSVNGEELRREMEAWEKENRVSAAFCGVGFLLSVVGIWGDCGK